MADNDKNKSNVKETVIVLSIVIPTLFIFICGGIWVNGGFDRTIMEQLFPAIFFGFLAAVLTVIILSNTSCKPLVWAIVAAIIFIATIIIYILNFAA